VTYEAAVLDYDGVLVEPAEEALLVAATRTAFRAHGAAADGVAEELATGVDPDRLVAACEARGLDPAALWATRDRLYSEAQLAAADAGGKPPYPDQDAVRARDAPMAVVTSNQQRTVDALLERDGLTDRFEAVFGRDPTLADLRRKKPDPHFVERALSELATDDAVMVGDSDSDLRAAHAAGVDAAYLRRPHRAGQEPAVDPEHDLDALSALSALLD